MLQSSTQLQSMSIGSLQAVHVNNNHCIAASTVNLNCSKAKITIYGSMNSSVSIQTKNILAKPLKTNEDSFTIQLAKVNKQSGADDCGVFVLAYCIQA